MNGLFVANSGRILHLVAKTDLMFAVEQKCRKTQYFHEQHRHCVILGPLRYDTSGSAGARKLAPRNLRHPKSLPIAALSQPIALDSPGFWKTGGCQRADFFLTSGF